MSLDGRAEGDDFASCFVAHYEAGAGGLMASEDMEFAGRENELAFGADC